MPPVPHSVVARPMVNEILTQECVVSVGVIARWLTKMWTGRPSMVYGRGRPIFSGNPTETNSPVTESPDGSQSLGPTADFCRGIAMANTTSKFVERWMSRNRPMVDFAS